MTPWPFPPRNEAPPPAVPPVRAGAGLRLSANALGFTFSAAARSPGFDFPWRPSLTSGQITFRSGRVNTFEPKIEDVPISGDEKGAVPALTLDKTLVNDAGESWVCLDVYPDEQGNLSSKSRIELVQAQATDTISTDPKKGRKGLCLILWSQGSPLRAIPAVHWNMTYTRVIPAAGDGPVKHFFL